jgi:uncharacterized repeat protein (TIGR01451 family)
LGALKPGEKKQLQLTASAAGVAERAINQVQATAYPVASATGVAGEATATPANLPAPLLARADSTIAIQGRPALRMTVTDSTDPVEVGERTTYRIEVVNQGSLPAGGVMVSGALPAQMKFLGARGTVPFKLDGQRVVFQPLNSLGVGETVTLLVDVEAVKPGVAVFQAEVSGGPLQKPVVKEEATTVR